MYTTREELEKIMQDPEAMQRELQESIELAQSVGVEEEKIIHSVDELDKFLGF